MDLITTWWPGLEAVPDELWADLVAILYPSKAAVTQLHLFGIFCLRI